MWRNNEIPRILQAYPLAGQFSESPEVRDVYVVPERRSQGVGTHLIRKALTHAGRQTSSDVTICVEIDNPRARALYERLGFSEPGIGVFTTKGTYTGSDGREIPWQNGLQLLLARSPSTARTQVRAE